MSCVLLQALALTSQITLRRWIWTPALLHTPKWSTGSQWPTSATSCITLAGTLAAPAMAIHQRSAVSWSCLHCCEYQMEMTTFLDEWINWLAGVLIRRTEFLMWLGWLSAGQVVCMLWTLQQTRGRHPCIRWSRPRTLLRRPGLGFLTHRIALHLVTLWYLALGTRRGMQPAMAFSCWIQSLMSKGGKFFSQYRQIDVEK